MSAAKNRGKLTYLSSPDRFSKNRDFFVILVKFKLDLIWPFCEEKFSFYIKNQRQWSQFKSAIVYPLFLTGIQCTYTINQNEIGVQEGRRLNFQSLVPEQNLQLVNINFENVLMTQNVKKYIAGINLNLSWQSCPLVVFLRVMQ